ncbi:efflux RND transporter periplasmic adaptor subunit [Candidatus Magnetobacterium casense]|uniref:Efflux RND transporter periplasmic adaptor subunit n=1 Tax=Candidatus Magnetobacterium casense TaxID=1455061 RepID=A0ABS6S4U9_9BACT|nr:efflux RND transporter periplasmic adaptor subunit [Candidatus Magnetobacterium casensis]MBV6343433.1 efflux RND transporter periplasmic adaptor subunit [Candidatus Magnetobacterium casensis]
MKTTIEGTLMRFGQMHFVVPRSCLMLFWFFSCVVFMCLLPGCKKGELPPAPAEKTINVITAPALKATLRAFVEATGSLEPFERVTVSSEVDGILSQLTVTEGARVSKGAVLARVNDSDLALSLKSAELAVTQAEASLTNLRGEFQRKSDLYKDQLVTKQQFDDISTRLAIAQAEVGRAKAAMELSRQRLDKTTIYSPLGGAVEVKKASAGDYVRNGTPLVTIIQTDPVKLNFTVPEKAARMLHKGQEVTFSVDALPQGQFIGKVSVIYPVVDKKTRTLEVEALVSNADGALRPGYFAHVTLYTGQPREVIAVPATALLYEGDSVKLYVVDGDKAGQVLVKVGQSFADENSGELTEITQGITAGQSVVVVGQQGLFDGARVKVQTAPKGDK